MTTGYHNTTTTNEEFVSNWGLKRELAPAKFDKCVWLYLRKCFDSTARKMNPPKTDDNNLNARSFTNVPSHGSLPKWLGDMAKTVKEPKQAERKRLQIFADSLETMSYKTTVPEVLNYQKQGFALPTKKRPGAEKNGRRSSLAAQLYATRTPKNITVSKSNYLIPNYQKFDVSALEKQDDLEKSWESLSSFRQSHRGRLDSAKKSNRREFIKRGYENTLPSISNLDADASAYSPSILEKNVPMRAKSEMSHHAPRNEDLWLVPKAEAREFPVQKSKSSENVFFAGDELFGELEAEHILGMDPVIGRSLNDYRLKVAKEDNLRQEIINELLSENDQITQKIKHRQKNVGLLRTPSYDEFRSHKKVINKSNELSAVDDFLVIPELPAGKTLLLHILSTWGDKYYVGLNGIEVFGSNGEIINVKKVNASPADVNVLPECKNDPRVVSNLLDGVNRTQDDVHLWLAPFEKGRNHTICLEFGNVTTVAMIRIWNYNKSRIHSYRGVRDLVMYLDDRPIFKGEIAKACGGILGGVDAFGDTILFTTDDSILELISQHDNSYLNLTSRSAPETPFHHDRPPTSAFSTGDEIDDRPYTGIVESTLQIRRDEQMVLGAVRIDLVLLSNWGYSSMVGLTGLEVVLENEKVLRIMEDQLSCSAYSDTLGLDRLISGQNLTNNPENMWCASYDYTQDIVISISLPSFVFITGIRIWNYNESLETTYAGVSRMRILLDGRPIKNPISEDEVFLLRRAPGNLHYDYVQDIRLCSEEPLKVCEAKPTFHIEHTHKDEFYESPTMPEGFVVQFVIFSTWNDPYYCGLNGIELFDRLGRKIILEECNICAYPESINVLQGVSGDVRTPDKLIDGMNDDPKGAHSWLAPIIPKCLNRIYVVFDFPVVISVIKIWNYSKTPARGVKDFGVLVDDLLVYNGTLDKHNPKRGRDQYRSVVFTDDASVIEQEMDTLIRHSSYGQEVLLLNDNFRSTTGGSLPEADPALRPFTSVRPLNGVHTSHSH